MDYTDYLYSCTLRDLKREAQEYKDIANLDTNKKYGTLILKLIACKLPKETSTIEFKINQQKIESERDGDLYGRFLFIN